MAPSAKATNNHSDTPSHTSFLQPSSYPSLEESTLSLSPYFMLSINPSKGSSLFPSELLSYTTSGLYNIKPLIQTRMVTTMILSIVNSDTPSQTPSLQPSYYPSLEDSLRPNFILSIAPKITLD